MKKLIQSYIFLFLAIFLGIFVGLSEYPLLLSLSHFLSDLFMNALKLLSLPVVFLSIIATLSSIQTTQEIRLLGGKVLKYTLFTTFLATMVALILFVIIDPTITSALRGQQASSQIGQESYISFFLKIIPSNLVAAFVENNVIGIAFIAFFVGIVITQLKEDDRNRLHAFFAPFAKLFLKMTEYVTRLIPLAIFAFTAILMTELKGGRANFSSLFRYLLIVTLGVFIQGFVILPLLLKFKGISPLHLAKGSIKALVLAFFSKSSNATLPVTLECAEKEIGLSSKVSRFSLPLCTVINMNGCAIFIFTTVLFVLKMTGHIIGITDFLLWMVLATLAAIGNAGVPMGCFFLSTMFLMGMHVPLDLMGIILPFYAFLDMTETALNVWSDICVTALVDRELSYRSVSVKE